MEAAQGEKQTIEILTRRILVVNFAAIQSSSMVNPNLYLHIIPYTELIEGIQSFVHALFYLAALPEYIGPLRAEVEEVIEREGWTKEALDQMYKVDSFIKESQRKTPLENCECRSILYILYADRNSRNEANCQGGLHIRGWHPYSSRNYSWCQSYTCTS